MGSQAEFAEALGGVTRGAVGNWELGKGVKLENLRNMSSRFSVSFDWLATGTGEPPRTVRFGDNEPATKVVKFGRPKGQRLQLVDKGGPALERNAASLPVYAAAQGGTGHLIITIDPVEYRSPPTDLLSIRGAHGILVVGDSMVPAYEPGDIAWVTPYRPPQRNKDVVLYHKKPEGEAEAMIKRLLNFTDRDWRLRQYNPAQDFTESRADWPICHQIHSKTNA